ncbi:hypothetical protein RvVAT039_27450 [Agrobacterium vitis]|nr:hypothetical protein RvVAT039_27450 [Agrobacterium vitis]
MGRQDGGKGGKGKAKGKQGTTMHRMLRIDMMHNLKQLLCHYAKSRPEKAALDSVWIDGAHLRKV